MGADFLAPGFRVGIWDGGCASWVRAVLPRGWDCLMLRDGDRDRYSGMLPGDGFFCVSLGAHRAAVSLLSGIGMPDSGCTADFTSEGKSL